MKFNKTNITKILIEIQDNDGIPLACNAIATKAIKQLGLKKIHQKITGNPDSAYIMRRPKRVSSATDEWAQHSLR